MDIAKTVALTAVGGLVVGVVGCGSSESKDSSTPAAGTEAAPAASQAAKKACCKGQNDCKGKGNCKGEADVKGDHVKWNCAGQNPCSKLGGCHAKDCTP